MLLHCSDLVPWLCAPVNVLERDMLYIRSESVQHSSLFKCILLVVPLVFQWMGTRIRMIITKCDALSWCCAVDRTLAADWTILSFNPNRRLRDAHSLYFKWNQCVCVYARHCYRVTWRIKMNRTAQHREKKNLKRLNGFVRTETWHTKWQWGLHFPLDHDFFCYTYTSRPFSVGRDVLMHSKIIIIF